MSKSAILFTHHIFLTKEQRYGLLKPANNIEIMGICSIAFIENGVWKNNASDEIFTKYSIVFDAKPEQNTVKLTNGSFIVTLTGEMPNHLLDIKDGGSECLMMTHRNVVEKDGKTIPVVHFIEIEDISLLINSIN